MEKFLVLGWEGPEKEGMFEIPQLFRFSEYLGRSKDAYFDLREFVLGGVPCGKFLDMVWRERFYVVPPSDVEVGDYTPGQKFWEKAVKAAGIYVDPDAPQSGVGDAMEEAAGLLLAAETVPFWMGVEVSRVLEDLGRRGFRLPSEGNPPVPVAFGFETCVENNRTFVYSAVSGENAGVIWTEAARESVLEGVFSEKPVVVPAALFSKEMVDRTLSSGLKGPAGAIEVGRYRFSLVTDCGVYYFSGELAELEGESFYPLVVSFCNLLLGEDETASEASSSRSSETAVSSVFPGFGGFWLRLVAWIVDSIPIGIALGVACAPLPFLFLDMNKMERFAKGDLSAFPIFYVLLLWLVGLLVPCVYEALCYSSKWQATLGKKLLGMRVVTLQGEKLTFLRGFGRSLVKYTLSSFVCYLGFLWVAFEGRKRAWHDLLAGTLVVKP
jgi:uncharacterized RDD family membrane protein YckC